jgi:hypothetical protein
MRKILIFFAAGLMFLFLIPSCYYDNVEDLYPFESSACDTTNVTYSQTIAPIMAANCNVCHNSADPQYTIYTDNYADLSIIAKNGQLWKAVSHDPSVVPMPYQGNKLSDCNLSKINIWIKAGSPNN